MEKKCDSTEAQIWVLHLGYTGCDITYKSDCVTLETWVWISHKLGITMETC